MNLDGLHYAERSEETVRFRFSFATKNRDGEQSSSEQEKREMRKVVASPFTSLDGYMSGLNGEIEWNRPYFDEEMASFTRETLENLDTLLFGRVTYEWFAQFWPTEGVKHDPGHAGLMNSLPKIVFSKSLEKAEWNNSRIVRENEVEEVNWLKQQEGKNMVIDGSPTLIHSFTRLGLIDEFLIRLHPVILGNGVPLFKQAVNLKLLEARPLRSGVIILRYQVVK
jgi:dihydrofolate reductase